MPVVKRTSDITRALRALYPHTPITTTHLSNPPRYQVRMPAARARYWGTGRDPAHAAAWLAWQLHQPCRITGTEWIRNGYTQTACVTVELTGGPMPADPRGSAGAPVYTTPGQVLGDLKATRATTALIKLAIDGGLRPHVDIGGPAHGLYGVLLSYPSRDGLFGGIWISETTGRTARGTFHWGNSAPPQKETSVAGVRRQLSSWLAVGRAAGWLA